jgi:hypothetical protein
LLQLLQTAFWQSRQWWHRKTALKANLQQEQAAFSYALAGRPGTRLGVFCARDRNCVR